MSSKGGIDQNGGAATNEEETTDDDPTVIVVSSNTDHGIVEDNNEDDDDDDDVSDDGRRNETETVTESSRNQDNPDSEEKVNKTTTTTEGGSNEAVTKTESGGETSTTHSRELKLLLALSKEARLDTNIPRKRLSNSRKKSLNKSGKIKYPITAESELEMEGQGGEAQGTPDDRTPTASPARSSKRKKESFTEDEGPRKPRRPLSADALAVKPNKDLFCWRCHKDNVNISCETCPRSYHQKCLKQTITDPDHWPCPECVLILKAESIQSRSPAMRNMTLEHLCSLLKFAVNRMIECQGSEPFIHAVNDKDFPEYKMYIIQPMDLTLLEKNIKENLYGSTQAFEADAKWILHNSIVFNSYQSKLTSVAKTIIKICKQEMAEIENCPSCYRNANTKKKTWFVEVCPKPHLLVWAKLRGFPFWPGKAMSCKDGMVDVRFFGAHDRAWVPEKECFLYSPKDPNLFRVKRADIEQCVEELEEHVTNLKKVFGEFNYPPFKTPIDPENELKQLQMFLPKFVFEKNKSNKSPKLKKDQSEAQKSDIVDQDDEKTESTPRRPRNEDETMEGYGTDDESIPEIDTELRKTLLKKSGHEENLTTSEADDEDIQVLQNTELESMETDEINIKTTKKKISESIKGVPRKYGSEPCSKRPSLDDSARPQPKKIHRRNSETKIETANSSELMDEIVISEDMELSLRKDGKSSRVRCARRISSSSSESSSDTNAKKKLTEVDANKTELVISPTSKLKMADKLIKRLSDVDRDSEDENLALVKRKIGTDGSQDESEEVQLVDSATESSETVKETIAKLHDKNQPRSITDDDIRTVDDVGAEKSKTTRKEDNRNIIAKDASEEKHSKSAGNGVTKDLINENGIENKGHESKQSVKTATQISPTIDSEKGEKSTRETSKSPEISSITKPTETQELNEAPEKNDIINIIHSSLSEVSLSAVKTKDTVKSKPGCNKRKRSADETVEAESETPPKVLKVISIESIMNKTNSDNAIADNSGTNAELSANNATPASVPVPEVSPMDIKSEPDSESAPVNLQDMEAKKRYLSALNILEKCEADAQKTKPNEIRTRSKTEERREKNRIANIITIDDVTSNASQENEATPVTKKKTVVQSTSSKSDGGEIFVKSFAKIATSQAESNKSITSLPSGKQRARKSFPQPNYSKTILKSSVQPPTKINRDAVRIITTTAGSTNEKIAIITSATDGLVNTLSTVVAPIHSSQKTVAAVSQFETVRPTNGYLILQSPQFLAPNQTLSYPSPISSQMMSMTPCLLTTNGTTQPVRQLTAQPQVWYTSQTTTDKDSTPESSNGNNTLAATTPLRPRALPNGASDSAANSSTLDSSVSVASPIIMASSTSTENAADSSTSVGVRQPTEAIVIPENDDGDNSIFNGILPENVTRMVNQLIKKRPPKLKPRPPGPLSQQFSEGVPSSAGPVAEKVNSIAHRLSDYFRGMLIETLEDMGKTDNHEATIANLKLEIETLKYQHSLELAEIEKNMCTVLKDLQRSIGDEREKIVEETRSACETETVKRVEEAKSKQWCANCSKEAQFYCCWNTSYCDYPCQQKHWSSHMNKCTQNVNQPAQISPATSTIRTGGQQLILRPANPPPKGGVGRVYAKPLQKVYMNRNFPASKAMRVQTSSGNVLTMMETTPGNYQLVTTSSLIKPGSAVKSPGLVPITSSSVAKNVTPLKTGGPSSNNKKQPARRLGQPIQVDEESD